MAQFLGLPVAAAVLPLPKVPIDVLDTTKLLKLKTLLDAQPLSNLDRMLWVNGEGFADSIVEIWQNDAEVKAAYRAIDHAYVWHTAMPVDWSKIDIAPGRMIPLPNSGITIECLDDA